ncbi:MAG: hypothetical protein P1U57_08975 [Oleibacter sp.]|nr:hypothetical protein [Thalassolituus sp.]
MNNKNEQPESRFERVFYRYLAWFPILVLPVLVWNLYLAGEFAPAAIIALIHIVLVFRFVSVNRVPEWFSKPK